MIRPALLSVIALALAACGPLVQIGGNTPAPDSLLTLRATAEPRPYAGPASAGTALGVTLPLVPGTLQTLRLPVTTSDTEVLYLAKASWAEQPNRQFQRLLADTLASAGLAVVDSRQSTAAPARSLTGTLREFGLDVRNPGAPVVRVRYDAQIAAPGDRTAPLLLRRFDASEPVPNQTPTAVAAALNRAANRLAADVALWAAN
jgi:cholesterol transport system auxiliary component